MAQKTMLVEVVPIDGADARVVKEGTFHRYHTVEDGAFEVPTSSYYHRKILHGELRAAKAKAAPKAKPQPKKDETR